MFHGVVSRSNDDVADFRKTEPATGPDGGVDWSTDISAASEPSSRMWVLCRRRAGGDVQTIRAFDDESRARADLELVESVSEDQYWLSSVPLVRSDAAGAILHVQALALDWLAQGAEAEVGIPVDDPVVVSPRHVRGFVSVPAHEWRLMEERGWVRDGLITPEGAAQVGQAMPRG